MLTGVSTAVVSSALCTGAQARSPGEPEIQALLEGGGGVVFANSPAPAGKPWSWSICDASGANCRPFGSGQEIQVGRAPAGVTFKLSGSQGTTLTPVWNGPLTLLSGPSVTGTVEANSLVAPVLARWGGGWTGDYAHYVQLAACASSDGRECTSLTDEEFGGECRHGGTVIDPIFTGWYLQVSMQLVGPGSAFAEVAYSTPYRRSAREAGPQTAVAMVGRIAAAKHPRTDPCGPPPLDPRVSPRAPIPVQAATISTSGVAQVACWADPCIAVLKARHGRAIRAKRLTFLKPGRWKASIKPSAVIERGRVRYTLSVDGEVLARRTLKVRQAARHR